MTYQEIFKIISQNIKKILSVTGISAIIIFLFLLLVYPITYNAEVTVLPPEKNTQMMGLSTLLGGQDFSSLLTGSMSGANSQLYMEILKSRSASEYVVNKFNLINYLNAKNIFDAADKLEDKLNVEVTKEGIIKLSVNISSSFFPLFVNNIDSVKNLSADVSNAFIEALDKINREKLSSKAKQTRIFLEEQLKETRLQLDSAENNLMNFQERNKAIALPEQVTAAIDAAAKIKAEIVETEIDLGLAQSNLRSDNKALIAIKSKLEELKSQYSKMEMGNQDYLLAFRQVPELGKELANLLREVKIQNEVYLLLEQQYYKEKIQENRDVPVVEILDKAVPPLKASSPRLFFATVMGSFFVFIVFSFLILYSQKKNNKVV